MWLFAVTAGLLTVFDFRPAATVSFPQVDKPARPLTASPRPLPVCSANTPIPPSALAAPWTPLSTTALALHPHSAPCRAWPLSCDNSTVPPHGRSDSEVETKNTGIARRIGNSP